MRKLVTFTVAFALSSATALVFAQVPGSQPTSAPRPPEHFYRLNVVLEEVNDAGKVQNSRSYTAIVSTAGPGQTVRTGSRVPIATGAGNGATQIQYLDVGVNLDVRDVKERGGNLAFRFKAEVSSLATAPAAGTNLPTGDPVLRQNLWDSTVLIPVGKATIVDSADNLEDKGKFQVEVTATPVQ